MPITNAAGVATTTQPFSKNLYFRMEGGAVKELQQFLTNQGVYTGPISGKFLSVTYKAVIAFQKKEGIVPPAGYFGPSTRAKAQAIVLANPSSTVAVATTTIVTNNSIVGTASAVGGTVTDIIAQLQARINGMFQQLWTLQSKLFNKQNTPPTTTPAPSAAPITNSVPTPTPVLTGPQTAITVNTTISGGTAIPGNFILTVKDVTTGNTIFSSASFFTSQFQLPQQNLYTITEATTSASSQYSVTLGSKCSGTTNTSTIVCTITNKFIGKSSTPTSTTTNTPSTIPTPTKTPTTTPNPAPTQTVPTINTSGIQWGAFPGGSVSGIASLESLAGKKMNIVATFTGWGSGEGAFPTEYKSPVADQGKTLLIFWEQYNTTLDSINSGSQDSYIAQFAAAAKAYNGPIILAPFHEMNGNWDPWDGTVGNNSPAKLISAWIRIHNAFAGISNVKFGWAPNNVSEPTTAANDMSVYYPGDAYVDYVGVDGFNFGNPWQTWSQVFSSSLTKLSSYNKPVYIFSMGTVAGSQKAQWITDMGTQLKNYPKVVGWVWFNNNGSDGDFLINTDTASVSALQSILK